MFDLKLLWQNWFAYLFGLGSPSRSSSFEGRSGTLVTKSFKKSNWFSDVIHLFLWIQTIMEQQENLIPSGTTQSYTVKC